MTQPSRSKASANDYVSLTEFARIRGVASNQVTRWLTANPPMPYKLVGRRKMVSVSQANSWLAAGYKAGEAKKQSGRGQMVQQFEPDPLLRRQAIARTEMMEAQSKRELARTRRELGELVDREPMVRALQALAIAIKTELMEAPQSIADEIGAEFGIPVATVKAALDRKVRRILNNISDGIGRIA